jgi:hypothetical protein
MVAQVSHRAPSGRFIRGYLLTWGLLAAGGLVYLASLAWHPDLFTPSQQTTQPDPSLQAATKALAEIGTVRRTVTEIQGDLGRLKSTIDQRAAEERASQARLSALEERVTTIATASVEPVAAPGKARMIETAKAEADRRKATAETTTPRTARIITIPETTPKAPLTPAAKPDEPAAAADPPRLDAPKIETGSIGAPTITFGEPEVTPARQSFAVQLAAGPSLDALRLSWSLLRERHAGALGTLQPRFVPPRTDGGPYRLLAGPFQSKAEADKACTDMGVTRKSCFPTAYLGQPL